MSELFDDRPVKRRKFRPDKGELDHRMCGMFSTTYFNEHIKPQLDKESLSDSEFVRRAVSYYVRMLEKQQYTVDAIRRYATEGKGFGIEMANRIVRRYKVRDLEALDTEDKKV